jgi:hypothetical protein
MSGLTFTNDPSTSLPDKPLKAADVGVDLFSGDGTYEGEQQLAFVKFAFSSQANASIEAFNSLDDQDQDGVLGKLPKAGQEFDVALPPQIELTEADAWLKYRFAAEAKVSASGAVSPVEFKLDGSKAVIFTDFHVHSREDNTRAAVQADLQDLRFAANAEDVFKLGDKEALSYQVRGELSASLTLSWSDVFTSSLSELSKLLKSGRMLALQISPSASVSFNVGVVDDFRLIFTKGSGETISVALKKSDSRAIGVEAMLGVSVQFANPDDVKEVLNKLIESVADQQMERVEQILSKANLNDLTDEEHAIVQALLDRLGLTDAAATSIDVLRTEWEALKKEVEATVTRVAQAKVSIGFSYEYLRVRTEDTLLLAELDRDTFRRFHNDLMLCDLLNLLDWLRENPAALKKYLNQTTLKRSHAWGFSLGFAGGKDMLELTTIVQKNIQGNQRVAYNGIRSYEGKWLGDKVSWTVDFKAEMEGFSQNQVATACEFQYGLHFKWLWEDAKLKEDELQDYLDYAIIWRAITVDNINDVVGKIKSSLNQKAQLSVELTIDDPQLRALLALAAQAPGDLPTRALAKAMPYMKNYDARRLPKLRELCYAPLWKFYFEHDDLPVNAFPLTVANAIEKITQLEQIPHGRELAFFEKGSGRPENTLTNPFTFTGQVSVNGKTVDDYSGIHRSWLEFAGGLSALRAAIDPNNCAPHQTIEGIFTRLRKFWSQTLYIRAAGIYLLDLASTDSTLLRQINRAFTVSFEGGDVFTFNVPV